MTPSTQSTAIESAPLVGVLRPDLPPPARIRRAAARRPAPQPPARRAGPPLQVSTRDLHRALRTLTGSYLNPNTSLRLRADGGWIYLTGKVDWYYQKAEIERLIRSTPGVRGLSSDLVILGLPNAVSDAD